MNATPPPARTGPRLLNVASARHLGPNMIRVTLTGDGMDTISEGCEGANCKLLLPEPGQSRADFAARLADGPRPVTRTYTVRHFRKAAGEIDIDFVAHGDNGPASAWAARATAGDFIGFAGPGPVKVASFHAGWYLLAADLSALPVVAATLEAMPRSARGIAFFEVPDAGDRQQIAAPPGVVQHWIVTAPGAESPLERLIRAVSWPTVPVQTCIAGESGTIKAVRHHLHVERGIPRDHTYISGYWKRGMIEDEHQAMKRRDSAADTGQG